MDNPEEKKPAKKPVKRKRPRPMTRATKKSAKKAETALAVVAEDNAVKKPGGKPVKLVSEMLAETSEFCEKITYSVDFKKKLAKQFENFIEAADGKNIPSVAKFAAKVKLHKKFFFDNPEYFAELILRCNTKKEALLEDELYSGKSQKIGAIFALKQPGCDWVDNKTKDEKGSLQVNILNQKIDLSKASPEELRKLAGYD